MGRDSDIEAAALDEYAEFWGDPKPIIYYDWTLRRRMRGIAYEPRTRACPVRPLDTSKLVAAVMDDGAAFRQRAKIRLGPRAGQRSMAAVADQLVKLLLAHGPQTVAQLAEMARLDDETVRNALRRAEFERLETKVLYTPANGRKTWAYQYGVVKSYLPQ